MEAIVDVKPLAFKKVNSIEKNRKHLEEVMESSLSIENDSMQYDEIGGILEREFSIDARENSAVKMLTLNILQTYKKCKHDFDFEETMKPRRELTIHSEGVYNEGKDNVDFNLIVCVLEEIKGPSYTYIIVDLIGQGISGQVFKCIRKEDNTNFAIKVIKNKKAYKNQALIELRILEILNNEVDKQDLHHIIRLFDHFVYKEHLCIIFELLNENLFELLRQNYFKGISLISIRFIIKQILEAVYQLQKANLIHCDLKPENILLKIDKDNYRNDIVIKITDFGSACFKNHTMFQYIQSRYYRAPEVLTGAKYSCEIDIWSIGCIAAELFLGEPIFPGSCEFDQLSKIIKLIGEMPPYLIREGKNSRKYFTFDQETNKYRIKTVEEYYKEFPNEMEPKYEIPFDLKSLDDIVTKTNKKQTNLNSFNSHVNNDLESFVHFLKGLLIIDPNFRWNAKQALRHPFITKEKFEGYFNPNTDEVSLFLHSVEGSYLSENYPQYTRYPNANMYHSMINPNTYINNISASNSVYHDNTHLYSSIDMSVYQPNLNKIPLRLLKNFPYAKIDEINLKPDKHTKKKKNYYNKFDATMNNTFTKTSHDELYVNNSFTSDKNFHAEKKRQVKDDMLPFKNKYSQLSRMVQNINMYNMNNLRNFNCNAIPNNMNVIPNMNLNSMPFNITNQATQIPSVHERTDKRKLTSQTNKSLFSKDNYPSNKEYEGLMDNYADYNNLSFDIHDRARSKSEYYCNNLNNQKPFEQGNNNLNYSNWSTFTNERDNHCHKQQLKSLSGMETPVINTKNFYRIDDKESNGLLDNEIKEEEHQGDEEFSLKFN